jgi:hypothetical protein
MTTEPSSRQQEHLVVCDQGAPPLALHALSLARMGLFPFLAADANALHENAMASLCHSPYHMQSDSKPDVPQYSVYVPTKQNIPPIRR